MEWSEESILLSFVFALLYFCFAQSYVFEEEDGFFVSLRCCRSADLIRKARLLTRSPNGCATLRFAPLEAQNDKKREWPASSVCAHIMRSESPADKERLFSPNNTGSGREEVWRRETQRGFALMGFPPPARHFRVRMMSRRSLAMLARFCTESAAEAAFCADSAAMVLMLSMTG